MSFLIRLATLKDVDDLQELIRSSVLMLQQRDYTPRQIEGALGSALGLDTQLIRDGTYFVAYPADRRHLLVACGGWSSRKTVNGSDQGAEHMKVLLDPATVPAKIRAIFVHPQWARQGLGSMMLTLCEQAAKAAGFHCFEMGSTLTAVPLYSLKGYGTIGSNDIPLPNGEVLPVVHMRKGRC